MEEFTILVQIALSISVFYVWIFRFHNVIIDFKNFELSDVTRSFVGASKIALSTLIFAGIWFPPLVFVPSILLGLFMVSAQYFHAKVSNPFIKRLPSLILLALCVFLALRATLWLHMDIIKICILISSLSFFAYTTFYFISPKMKMEFKRFGLEKFGRIIIVSQFLGALGLFIGLWCTPLLILSSFGLAFLMLAGVIVRLLHKDSIRVSLPALFYCGLNSYIFYASIT